MSSLLALAFGVLPVGAQQRFDPELPSEALTLRELDVRCTAKAAVDVGGFVYRLEVLGCDGPYRAATEAALWRWVIPPATPDRSTLSIEVRFAVVDPAAGGTGSPQVQVGEPVPTEPFAPTVPPTVPLTALTIEKQKSPDVSAAMLFLSQEKGIVEVFCRAELVVDEKGKVASLALHECHPDLVAPLEAAVRKWRFSSAQGLAGGRRLTVVIPVRSFTETRGLGTSPL
jgi:hypothetical protein